MKRVELVLDTMILGGFLAEYYHKDTLKKRFQITNRTWDSKLREQFNYIVRHYEEYQDFDAGIIVASSFAFVEVARKLREVCHDQVQPYQLAAFLRETPGWFIVEPLSELLLAETNNLPSYVEAQNGSTLAIEMADAIHAATMFLRGESAILGTTDQRLKLIPQLQGRILG